MKKYTSTLLALLLAGTFIGCGSSNDTKVKEDANTSTPDVPKEETTPPVQEQTQKMPTCYIKEGTPKTDSSIVVHAKCKNGNIPIDEAKVTLDNTVKSVDYKGVYFSDYIGFDNLQPSTTYKAVLEVVVGGKTITESVKIKTREEKVVITPTPTPTPIIVPPKPHIPDVIDNPQSCSKSLYKTKILVTYSDYESAKNKIILNLNDVCYDSENDPINYSIIKVVDTYYINNITITRDILIIEDGILKVKLNRELEMLGKGSDAEIIATVRVKSNGKYNDIQVAFKHLLPLIEPSSKKE